MTSSRQRLRELGADEAQTRTLIRRARECANALIPTLKDEIYRVAAVLLERRTLAESEIDALI
jgi:hypothetical protein